ncbi:hypothetical protein EDB86DRAFT_2807530, partial [Lactarius hatsudake]
MHTLDKGLNYVFLQQACSSLLAKTSVFGESTTLWPCPGLSEDDEPRIETYLLWTTVPSAGGVNIEAVAEQMYNTRYRDLTEDQKRAVRAGQVHTHRWSLDHQRRHVFAIGEKPCLRKVIPTSGQPRPCCACKALLGYRAFQTTINRDVPDDVNRKFTPLLYQAAEIAKICAKHSGLGKIFDKDAPHDQLLFRFAHGVADGIFKDKPMFLTFTSAMVTLSECHNRGHRLQGMRYPPAFDEWC